MVCVIPMSDVTPSVVTVLVYDMRVLLSVITGCALYLQDQGVIWVSVD